MRSTLLLLFAVACNLVSSRHYNSVVPGSNVQAIRNTAVSEYKAARLQSDNQPGTLIYNKYCLTCHQADGSGVSGMFPPLAGNDNLKGPVSDLIRIVLFGKKGPVTINGRDYTQPMPPQKFLTDKQVADVLSFIRKKWGNISVAVPVQDVSRIRKAGE